MEYWMRIITSFSTQLFDSGDPEGVTFDSVTGYLYIVDGINREVYRVAPGPNGIFDGVAQEGGDDRISHFDTLTLGINDPEGIAFNSDNGNLFIIGEPENLVAEITTDGNLLRLIDISAANPLKPAGLAYAPSSMNPLEMSLYIVDRGVDNNDDPEENDGKIYEISIPAFTPSDQPPVWNAETIGIGSAVNTATSGKVTIEFDTAFDDVDGANVKFNIYYAPTESWNNDDWNDANHQILYDVNAAAGATYAHAFTIDNLVNSMKYTFGVRAEDQSGNEESNTTTLTAIPTGFIAELIFEPVADTYVNSRRPNDNFGSQNVIDIGGYVGEPSKIAYLRFDVTGLVGTVQSASIQFLCENNGKVGDIYKISDNSWNEGVVTFNSSPAIDGAILDSGGTSEVQIGAMAEYDVSAGIAGNGLHSFAIVSTYDNAVRYYSRENGVDPPILIIKIDLGQDLTPPVWDEFTGIQSAADTATGGSVELEFDTATDAVDGANVKFNVYYAPSTLWNPNDWKDPEHSVLADVTTTTGATYAHAFTVTGLTDDVNYTFGVRVEDQSVNEDVNTTTLAATPTLFIPDTTAPAWDGATTGIGLATDTTTGGSVMLEFDTATDLVDGTNVKFNVYYAETGAWDNGDWTHNTLLADVALADGATYAHAFAVAGLTDDVNYTFGVRVRDQSDNEDVNTTTLAATPTLFIPDTTAPAWDGATTGIGLATDTTTGGSVMLEFDTATDLVDGTNVKFNVYYAETGAWDNGDWTHNTLLADVALADGATYAHAFTVTGLTDDVNYTFGVRVEDQSVNEDVNTTTLAATPTLFIPDTTAPAWDGATTGIGLATDTTTGGSVMLEFDTATDLVDGTNVKFNVYYAETGAWDNGDWTHNTLLADVALAVGATYAHAFTVTGLTDDVNYTFGVRVRDQSDNEDANPTTLAATPTGPEICVGDFDGDKTVDEADLAVFSADFGRVDCTTDCEGDFDSDLDVDSDDLSVFVKNFRRTDCP